MQIGSQTTPLPSYEEALVDAFKARRLFDASKGGNVRGITENHRYELANVFQRAMNASQQAAGARNLAGTDHRYPFRCLVWEVRGIAPFDVWSLSEVFEWETMAGAELVGLETCTEPYADGVTAMHYVVGEIGFDSEGYAYDQPREWSDDELTEVRRREFANDDYGRDI